MKLTLKQKAFADYYIQLGNATQAAIKAGYKENYAGQNADKLLKNTNVKEYLDKQLKSIESKRIADGEEVMQYLTKVMRGEFTEEAVVVESVGDFMSEARTIKKEVGAKDRIKAAELLGKRYSLFTEKVDINGKVPVQIIDDIPEDDAYE